MTAFIATSNITVIPENPDSVTALSQTTNVKAATGGTIGDYFKNCVCLAFDLSSLVGQSVVSATFDLYRTQQCWSTGTIAVGRILVANNGWSDSSTWNYKTPSTARWAGDAGSDGGEDAGCTQSGTDFATTLLGSESLIDGRAAGAYSITLTPAQVELLIANNYGIRLYTDGPNEVIATITATNPSERPTLNITTSGGSKAPVIMHQLQDQGIS